MDRDTRPRARSPGSLQNPSVKSLRLRASALAFPSHNSPFDKIEGIMKDRINQDLTLAVKARDNLRRDVLRMLKSKILENEVGLREKRGRSYQLSSQEVKQVVAQYAKQRKQSIKAYQEAGRPELVEKEMAELRILEDYLPKSLSRDEIEALVAEVIRETEANRPSDLGRVMKTVMARLQGTGDGTLVSQIVREKLNSR